MRRRIHFRKNNDWVDIQMDGMKENERLKGKDKKIFQRRTRNWLKKIDRKEINESDY